MSSTLILPCPGCEKPKEHALRANRSDDLDLWCEDCPSGTLVAVGWYPEKEWKPKPWHASPMTVYGDDSRLPTKLLDFPIREFDPYPGSRVVATFEYVLASPLAFSRLMKHWSGLLHYADFCKNLVFVVLDSKVMAREELQVALVAFVISPTRQSASWTGGAVKRHNTRASSSRMK